MQTSMYQARNAQRTLKGLQIVPELKDTEDSIGSMESKCKFCGALKWKNETPSLCCNSGKVLLDPFPDPPDILKQLLIEDTEEAKICKLNTKLLSQATFSTNVIH